MHTILGARGVIATELARTLYAMRIPVRLVSRSPRKLNASDEILAADLLDRDGVRKAVTGAEVVYLAAGLRYQTSVWRVEWPRIMDNVIEACKEANARLVFFDNVYAYGKVEGPMTEETPVNPVSKKGEIRALIARRLLEETRKGSLRALIARAPDFYGPGTTMTFVHPLVFDRLRTGKKPQWFVNDAVPHSLIYTPDAGRATALLGTNELAFGHVWHLPTAKNPPTGAQFIERAAQAFGRATAHQVLSPFMLRLAGLFVPVVRESIEMLYQYEAPYLFDSSRFERQFGFSPTTYDTGILAEARWVQHPAQ